VFSFSKLQTCIQINKYIYITIIKIENTLKKKLKVSKTWTKVAEGHGHPLVWGMINMPNYGSWYGTNISELDLCGDSW